MGVVSRRWMWVESMGVVSGCNCKRYRKRRNFRCKKISRFMDWAHNFLFSYALIFVVQVGVVNSLWTGPIIFNFRAH